MVLYCIYNSVRTGFEQLQLCVCVTSGLEFNLSWTACTLIIKFFFVVTCATNLVLIPIGRYVYIVGLHLIFDIILFDYLIINELNFKPVS